MKNFKPRPCRLFLFDLDGTLIDSKDDIATAVNLVLDKLEFPPLPVYRVIEFVGNGVKKLLERTLREIHDHEPDEDLLLEGIRIFREEYAKHMLDQTRLYPGVDDALRRLSWADMAVVSNKPERYSKPILEGLGVSGRFRAILGEETAHAYKPDPAPLKLAMELCGAAPSDTVMVGDSFVDIEAGKAAGVTTCAVTGGFHTREEILMYDSDMIINDLHELSDYFYDGIEPGQNTDK
ncbi:MAG: HAD-IA family hydrolase [Acidobacteria bacterium]|nr:HAD-IA family hydrolase [Acidobacteriota bacterium]